MLAHRFPPLYLLAEVLLPPSIASSKLDLLDGPIMVATFNPRAEAMRQQLLGGGPGVPPVLQNHPTQSVTTIDRWKSLLFGIPFLLCGAFVWVSALNILPSRKHAPDWLIALVGSFFLLGGVFFITHGVHGILKEAAHDREAAAHPDQPWIADYHWNREGFTFSAFSAMLSRLFPALFWYAFLIPFFWVGVHVHGTGRAFLVGAVLFALIGLVFWVRWAKMFMELLRYGNAFLAFDDFPFYPGGMLRTRLRTPRHFEAFQELTVTFRCVQERYELRGMGRDRSTQVVCHELYREVANFTRERLMGAAASSYLPLSFRVPENQPTTRLSDTPPTYWEIEVRGKADRASYEAYFLVPVYRTP